MKPIRTEPVSDEPGNEPTKTIAEPIAITREKVLDYLAITGLFEQMTLSEREQYVRTALEYQLNPYKRELHCSFYGEGEYRRFSCIVGYEVYIKRAERTGKLNGWRVFIEGDGDEMRAVLEVNRKDWAHPFRHEAYWQEAAQRKRDGSVTGFWQKMPRFQLKKVALSQGFRLCFPDELGGLPYEASELPIEEELAPSTHNQLHEAVTTTTALKSPELCHSVNEGLLKPPVEVIGTSFDPIATSTQNVSEVDTNELDAYLAAHYELFTDKHREWIKAQVMASPSPDKIRAMLAYANKVVNNTRIREMVRSRPQQRRSRLPDVNRVPQGTNT